jgi:hypothetical protein
VITRPTGRRPQMPGARCTIFPSAHTSVAAGRGATNHSASTAYEQPLSSSTCRAEMFVKASTTKPRSSSVRSSAPASAEFSVEDHGVPFSLNCTAPLYSEVSEMPGAHPAQIAASTCAAAPGGARRRAGQPDLVASVEADAPRRGLRRWARIITCRLCEEGVLAGGPARQADRGFCRPAGARGCAEYRADRRAPW